MTTPGTPYCPIQDWTYEAESGNNYPTPFDVHVYGYGETDESIEYGPYIGLGTVLGIEVTTDEEPMPVIDLTDISGERMTVPGLLLALVPVDEEGVPSSDYPRISYADYLED